MHQCCRRPKTCTVADICSAAFAVYSMTSSASASSLSGTVRPSAFAVFRLRTTTAIGRAERKDYFRAFPHPPPRQRQAHAR
jgi:hypothetical protein